MSFSILDVIVGRPILANRYQTPNYFYRLDDNHSRQIAAMGDHGMLFITYYELSNDAEIDEILEAGNLLLEAGLWPPEGMEVIRWDATANNWGVTIAEADDFETVYRAQALWEALVPGMFEEIKTVPAAPVEEVMAEGGAILDEVAELE